MGDEPPEPLNWNQDSSSPSFFGCMAGAFGLVFLVTGGTCVYLSFSTGQIGMALIGLAFAFGGWKMISR